MAKESAGLTPAQRQYFADPYPAYRLLRQQPLVWDDSLGVWQVTHFRDVDAILRDKRFLKNPPGELAAANPFRQNDRFNRGILNLDPPDHTRLRGLMVKAFSARRVAAMRPKVEALVGTLLEAIEPRREMELKSEYAHPIPATIISDMLGIPANDRKRFAELSNDIIRFGNDLLAASDEAADKAVREFDGYLAALVADKRKRPSDDLTSALIEARDEEGTLDEEELVHNVRLLFVAGHETTVNLICNAVVALHANPHQRRLLAETPALMPQAVEEFLRFESSVLQLPRIAQEDVEMHGRQIKAGQMVLLMLGSANHDPETYPDGDVLDVEREFVRAKSFGGGAHFCLGAQLARIETEIALNALLAMAPEFIIDNADALTYPPNPFFRGPDAVHVSW